MYVFTFKSVLSISYLVHLKCKSAASRHIPFISIVPSMVSLGFLSADALFFFVYSKAKKAKAFSAQSDWQSEGGSAFCSLHTCTDMHWHVPTCPSMSWLVPLLSWLIVWLFGLCLCHFTLPSSRETANTAALNIYLFVQHTPLPLPPATLHTPFGWIRTCVCNATGLQKDTPGQFAVLLISLCKGHKTHNEQTNKQTDRPRDRCMDRQRQQQEGTERDRERGEARKRKRGVREREKGK